MPRWTALRSRRRAQSVRYEKAILVGTWHTCRLRHGLVAPPRSCWRCSGSGSGTAAALLVTAGDNPGRLRSETAWAHLCGTAPIPASSGKVTRYRLSRGGDRQANCALWGIVITRLRNDPRTRAYMTRRLGEGRSKPEVIRVLKRYVAREVYHHLPRT
jgi:transposase